MSKLQSMLGILCILILEVLCLIHISHIRSLNSSLIFSANLFVLACFSIKLSMKRDFGFLVKSTGVKNSPSTSFYADHGTVVVLPTTASKSLLSISHQDPPLVSGQGESSIKLGGSDSDSSGNSGRKRRKEICPSLILNSHIASRMPYHNFSVKREIPSVCGETEGPIH